MAPVLPLAGMRVLDFSRLLPGPYCTLLLADLGADVVKVEDPDGGDSLRSMPPMAGELSALFHALNRNKRSLALRLKGPEGVRALLRLVPNFDVVVEGFRPGVMARLGLSYEVLAQANPRVIVCSLSGYGQQGPLAGRAGHDLTYVARSGVLGYSGDEESVGTPGVQVADIGGALFAAVGILAAVQERERTGRGRRVDVALCESSLAFLHMHLGARLALGGLGAPLARGRELLNGGAACYRVYRTRDGRHLAVAALEPKFWTAFCDAVERPDLADLGWSSGPEGRRAVEEVQAIVGARTLAEWEQFLAGRDLCCEPVREGDEVLEEPALVARGAFFSLRDEREGRAVGQLRTPLHLGDRPATGAPALGQHTEEVLSEAGFAVEEIAALRGAGALGER